MAAKRIDIGRYPGDFWERTCEAWADIVGKHWQMCSDSGTAEPDIPIEQLYSWLAEGAQRLTDRQRIYIDAYYNQGLSMELIAREQGVDKSSVARGIQRGMVKLQEWVEAKKLIALHTDQEGNSDWKQILEQLPAPLLSQRQRQLLIIKISNPSLSDKALSDILGLKKCTVSKTLKRACHHLQTLGVLELLFYSGCGIDWEQLLEKAGVLTKYQQKVVLIKLSNPKISRKEIGAAIGTTQDAVISTLSRAKHNLQQLDELEGIPITAMIKILNRRSNSYEFVRN